MQDMQAYLEKLSTVAVDCALISKRATDAKKKELFDRLADHLDDRFQEGCHMGGIHLAFRAPI